MFVQPIAMINCRKPHFTSAPERNKNGRWLQTYATIQDLYDSEDRIMEHQEKLIREQSSQIAKTLNMMACYLLAPDTINNRNFGVELNKLGIANNKNRSPKNRHIITV